MVDIYFDKMNSVLKNKLNIQESAELEQTEYQLVGYRMFKSQEKMRIIT